jgi:hypothetical protein
LNYTVTYIEGRNRLESVTIAQVDKKMNPIPGTDRKIKCDTLLLSLGLIPENELSKEIGIKIDPITGGPIVDQSFQTSIPGIFACGNCLQVYDTVDVLAKDANLAGKYASVTPIKKEKEIVIKPGKNIRYVVPQCVNKSGFIHFTMRTIKPNQSVNLRINADGKEILKKKQRWVNPANMIELDLEITDKIFKSTRFLGVFLDE